MKRPYSPLMLSTELDLKQVRPLRELRTIYNKMATIENLPQELIANSFAEEPSIFDYLNHSDKTNFSIALAGTIHEEFVTEKFLKPQLNIFATLDLNLKESLKNDGWFKECEDTKLIVRLWKELELKPSLPGIKTFV